MADLIDLDGPRVRAELRIDGAVRLGATVGAHALVFGATTTAVLTAGDAHLTPYQFPGRGAPMAAGAAARQFVVAVPGAIEEWDPQQRAPRRRIRLARPLAIAQVGGTERVVWMTTTQEPARIEVLAHANRVQPRAHELPEPIAQLRKRFINGPVDWKAQAEQVKTQAGKVARNAAATAKVAPAVAQAEPRPTAAPSTTTATV